LEADSEATTLGACSPANDFHARSRCERDNLKRANAALLERVTQMSVNVRNGTPIHGPSLCDSCMHAHVLRGFSESKEQVICCFTYPNHRVDFRVYQCNDYAEVKRQTLKQMEDMAWVLMPREGKRVPGFVRPGEIPEGEQIEIELKKKL
jgi:hypothetical protein